LKFKLS